MQARFLLGPAGSGKTFRCLAEIRAALRRCPDGPPLILISPKQATFQLERQLLAEGAPAGYTRLQVLSFERLAEFVFDQFEEAMPRLLSAEGRVMVLRALLRQHDGELKLLGASARRAGFAQELAGQLTELQQHQFGPARLRSLAADGSLRVELRNKLLDLALLLEKYTDWLARHELQDANRRLDLATERLRGKAGRGGAPLLIEHLWLDGFAEMTPQEHALLAAVAPFCGGVTLAFCLETEPTPTESWLSIWSAIGKTFQRCRDQLTALPGVTAMTEILGRQPGKNRFADGSATGFLEQSWALPRGGMGAPDARSQLSVTACASPEEEAVYAARELLKFVRGGNRFRDCAVLVRNLENYHRPLARVFRRYGIPFFLDRRENVAHHPLAELTRNALRTVANDWQHDDWFAALKAGFTTLPEGALDHLENAALEHGWRGQTWREPLEDEGCEELRRRIILPFDQLHRRLQRLRLEPTGGELAESIRELWAGLDVEDTLARWSADESESSGSAAGATSPHETVFDQMRGWLENVALAFPREKLPLRDWLPILEAGLAGLTVGVIPPALDEVLAGAIDRARNPDLKFTLLLGVNEAVFPAAPVAPVILSNSDRQDLELQNAPLGPNVLDQISRERYLGYIACTRASEKLALTFARQDADGRALNASPFIDHLQRMFPELTVGEFAGATDWREAEHATEMVEELVRRPAGTGVSPWGGIPAVRELAEKLGRLHEPDERENLSPALAERLHGPVLKSSVSRLEEFAQCPFRFFVHSGLRAEERKTFELDARERGSFQHEVLKAFHDELVAERKRWRDVTPVEARARVARIGEKLAPEYRKGLLRVDDRSWFAARAMTLALQDFVATLAGWMRGQYGFEPAKAETGFGLDPGGLPAWRLELDGGHALALRGRVDRIDVCETPEGALAVVMDYKSSSRKLDKIFMAHGIQLQLLAYLAAVRQWPADFFGAKKIVPAGVFYVNLRGHFESGDSRAEVLAEAEEARRRAYRHSGRFDAGFLKHFDGTGAGDQFNYILNKDGRVRANSAEALPRAEFAGLLGQVEEQLRGLGGRIFAGAAAVDPYRKGTATACEYCEYRAVCRIDEWAHEFRELRAKETEEA